MMVFIAGPSVCRGVDALAVVEAATAMSGRGRLDAAAMLAIPTRTRLREFLTGISLLSDMSCPFKCRASGGCEIGPPPIRMD
jgi:hypothetical protein